MLIGGAMAWFDSKKSTDFYDHMRQVESSIREAQSENVSTIVPGYGNNSDCTPKVTSSCPIQPGEEVYGTAVSMTVPAANTGSPRLKVWYLKRGILKGIPEQAEDIATYDDRDIILPADLRFEGYKIYEPSGGSCNVANYNSYRDLPYQIGTGGIDHGSTGSESLVVFRKVTGSYNTFWNDSGSGIGFSSGNLKGPKPVWNGSSGVPGWRGQYDDTNYIYSPAPTGSEITSRLKSQPCAVLWRFGSLERKAGGGPNDPRFTAEINFNLVDGTTRLVTR